MTRPIRSSRGSAALARRLRELREHHWPGQPLTQKQLADAFGGLSVGTISGYENERNPTTPPIQRLHAYSTFFASRRSIDGRRPRLVPDGDLDADERAARDSLLQELESLAAAEPIPDPAVDTRPSGFWIFPEGEPIRIVCGHLTDMTYPYGNVRNPNYTQLLTFADGDALLELWGQLWRLNPTCDIRFLRADQLGGPDDLGSNLVLLGGNGFNAAVQRIVALTDLPLRQVTDSSLVEDGDVFVLGKDKQSFLPMSVDELGLVEDVGLFARLTNPFNSARTLTLCSGVFSRGVLGAVRLLTDTDRQQQNEAYLARRFAAATQFAILMRVNVLLGNAVTPDLENPDVRLYEWPDVVSGGATETGERRTDNR